MQHRDLPHASDGPRYAALSATPLLEARVTVPAVNRPGRAVPARSCALPRTAGQRTRVT
jgi:hypothetical protein